MHHTHRDSTPSQTHTSQRPTSPPCSITYMCVYAQTTATLRQRRRQWIAPYKPHAPLLGFSEAAGAQQHTLPVQAHSPHHCPLTPCGFCDGCLQETPLCRHIVARLLVPLVHQPPCAPAPLSRGQSQPELVSVPVAVYQPSNPPLPLSRMGTNDMSTTNGVHLCIMQHLLLYKLCVYVQVQCICGPCKQCAI